MIFNEVTPSKQMALRGWSVTTPSSVITLPKKETLIETCLCDFFCDYTEKVFADLTDKTNEFKNDFRSFLLWLKDDTSTYSFNLIKGAEVIPLDNTLGILYNKGFNEYQPNQVGFKLNWLNVLEIHGVGNYKIELSQTDFGTETKVETHNFYLLPYSENASNNTVKIDFTQKGKVLGGQDYTGIKWRNMIRLDGKFGNHSPQIDINRTLTSNYEDIDIQVNKFNQYSLETRLIPLSIGNTLVNNICLTDEILVTVYNIFAYDSYLNLPVTIEGTIEPSSDFAKNNMKYFNITFKDRKPLIKRNFNA